ncbi:MAG: GlsB/YeaQ/YmgE family stress response membrane protein [Proteobacteria bacterium]|nr:GlsB/YeaQ/YmgE family stress response membrane protein [Pseudomonadota bacterium]
MIVIYTLLVGFVVGLIARALKPGDDRMGILATTAFGIGGALLAKYAGQALGWYGDGDAKSFLASLVGAIVLLTIFAVLRPKKKR